MGLISKIKNWIKRKENDSLTILARTHRIRLDEMGYPLRYVLTQTGKEEPKYMWLDTSVELEKGDIIEYRDGSYKLIHRPTKIRR